MKKVIVIGVIALSVIMSFNSISGIQINENIIKSSSRGNILYVGGSGEGNYSSIQDAIDNASDGDTIYVYNDSSPYYENLKVNKSINLVGEDKNTTVIDGGGIKHVIYVSANMVNVSRFTIRNGNENGIHISHSNYNTILGNTISNNGYGINYGWSTGNNIISNDISNNWLGVWGDGNKHNIIGNNISLNKQCGIRLFEGEENSILNNTISMNEGIGIDFGEADLDFSFQIEHSTVSGNDICYNGGSSLYLLCSSHNKIFNNYILGNEYGLKLEACYDVVETSMEPGYSNDNIIYLNNITSNDYGIYCSSYCKKNLICYNNFKENTKNAKIVGSNICFDPTREKGNYWDDYKGEDNDGDGIGDTPHIINMRNRDNYPFMEPIDFDNITNAFDLSITFTVTMCQYKATNNILLLRLLEWFPLLERLYYLFRI